MNVQHVFIDEKGWVTYVWTTHTHQREKIRTCAWVCIYKRTSVLNFDAWCVLIFPFSLESYYRHLSCLLSEPGTWTSYFGYPKCICSLIRGLFEFGGEERSSKSPLPPPIRRHSWTSDKPCPVRDKGVGQQLCFLWSLFVKHLHIFPK